MSKFSDRLKSLRQARGLSQQKLADILEISKSSINMYERGEREPGLDMLETIADFFNVDMDYLHGKTNIPNNSLFLRWNNQKDTESLPSNIRPVQTKRFPMLGEIACGEPIFANEDHISYIDASVDIKADFCLTAKGDSMTGARIYDGDVIFIKSQPMVNNGEIAAVIIDDEATLKRWYYYPEKGKLVLNPENPIYEPLVYVGEELNTIRCLGKAVCFMSNL